MIADTFPKIEAYIKAKLILKIYKNIMISQDVLRNLHPMSIISTEKIFSKLVVGATLPKPTEVREEKVK